MIDLINFTDCQEEMNEYKGSEKKKTLIYNNKKYLVKFPDPLRQKNKNISYINNAYSEYIGSHIFEITGFETQKTILGKYIINEKEKIVCACEDFTSDTEILYEFANLANSSMVDKKVDTEIEDILNIVKENGKIINIDNTIQNFWQMFIIDSLIGNTDRHNGNWGFIKNKNTEEIKFAPIYDCGSCLNPLLKDAELENLTEAEIKNLAINNYSCLKDNGKKINYFEYISSIKNKECTNALMLVFNKININEINNMIDNISSITDVRKKFYKEIINKRYNIIKKIYEMCKKEYYM